MADGLKPGPNVNRLIATLMARDACPPGSGVGDVCAFIMKPGSVVESAKKATQFVRYAVEAVRNAAEPNPWKAATDEEIAGEILRLGEEKRKRS